MSYEKTYYELKPIRESTEDYEEVEKKIKEVFKREIYLPLLKVFDESATIKNASTGYLLDALRFGRIQYYRGTFSGKFNSRISKALKDLGAVFKDGKWKITQSELPQEVKTAIHASRAYFEAKLKIIDKRLASVSAQELSDKINISKQFDKAIWKVERQFKANVAKFGIEPTLSRETRAKIADEWQNNMKLYIKGFTDEEIVKLRTAMQDTVFAGDRYESAVKTIQESYEVSARKAKFLARQETSLLMTTFKEGRYKEVGIDEYKWRCVKGTAAHPVRPMHQALNDRSLKGEIFRFDSPP